MLYLQFSATRHAWRRLSRKMAIKEANQCSFFHIEKTTIKGVPIHQNCSQIERLREFSWISELAKFTTDYYVRAFLSGAQSRKNGLRNSRVTFYGIKLRVGEYRQWKHDTRGGGGGEGGGKLLEKGSANSVVDLPEKRLHRTIFSMKFDNWPWNSARSVSKQ